MTSARTAPPIGVAELVEQLATAAIASRLHPAGHPAITRPVAAALRCLQQALAATGTDGISLVAAEGQLLFQSVEPLPPTLPVGRMLEILGRWKAVGIRILAGLTEAELATFVHLLVRPDEAADLAGLAQAAALAGCRRIGLIASTTGGPRALSATKGPRGISTVRDELGAAFTDVAAGAALDMAAMRRCTAAILDAVDASARADGEVLDLSGQREDDPLSVLHAVRVSALTMVTARSMTRDAELVLRLGTAGLLHDIGRMLLPLDLLQARADHDEAEDRLMMQHPALGAEFLLAQADADPLAVAVALGHHRTIRGDGYPATVHEHPVSRFTQLVRAADLFEALTALRPYRPALSPVRAYRTLLLHDHGIEPGLLRRFAEAVGIHPLGARVRLDSGERAVVVRQTAAADRPIVRIETPGGSGAPRGGLLDLSRPRSAALRIVEAGPDAG